MIGVEVEVEDIITAIVLAVFGLVVVVMAVFFVFGPLALIPT